MTRQWLKKNPKQTKIHIMSKLAALGRNSFVALQIRQRVLLVV